MTTANDFIDLTDQIKQLKGMLLQMEGPLLFDIYLGLHYFTSHFPNKEDSAYKNCLHIMGHVAGAQPQVKELADQFFAIVDQHMKKEQGVSN